METPHVYTPEQPSRIQQLAMRAAGLLLRQSNPIDTMDALVTKVGGYEPTADSAGRAVYRANVATETVMSLSDETTDSIPQQRFASGADHQDSRGTDLSIALGRTITRQRQADGRVPIRSRIAREFTRYAVRHVGLDGYIKR